MNEVDYELVWQQLNQAHDLLLQADNALERRILTIGVSGNDRAAHARGPIQRGLRTLKRSQNTMRDLLYPHLNKKG